MNYINITQPNQTLKLNLNYTIDSSDVGDDICFEVYEDGSDSLVTEWSGNISNSSYYQSVIMESDVLAILKDEKQYTIKAVDSTNNNVVYRGKFQTTSKDILDYSINENKYTQKINSTNYTILD